MDEIENEEKGKKLWTVVKKCLTGYGLGTDVTQSFGDMLNELNISYDEYILAIHSTIVRPQYFPECCPCDIQINNYMHNCLHIWRANHDIQPCLSAYAVI